MVELASLVVEVQIQGQLVALSGLRTSPFQGGCKDSPVVKCTGDTSKNPLTLNC
jgi:hypothetical protein